MGKKETINYFRKTDTKGQWVLPEHILICITVRHLFRSRELTTMLNRLGHSETYRFALGLETAIVKVLQGSSNHLSTQIVVNPASIAKALQGSSNLLPTQILGNPVAIAKASQGSSNLSLIHI